MEDRLEAEVRLATTETPAESTPALMDIPAPVLSQETQDLIARCIDGTEPIENAQSYHVDKFSTRHLQVVMLRLAGMRPGEIADLMGLSNSWISVILHHPYAVKIIKSAFPAHAVQVFDIRSRLEKYAGELLEQTFINAMKEDDLDKQSKVTFGLLDRAGFQPVNKNLNVNVPVKPLESDAKTLNRLAGALEESNTIDQVVMPAWRPAKPPSDGLDQQIDAVDGGALGTP